MPNWTYLKNLYFFHFLLKSLFRIVGQYAIEITLNNYKNLGKQIIIQEKRLHKEKAILTLCQYRPTDFSVILFHVIFVDTTRLVSS